ncbi:hypothetical protein [Raoultella sp. FYR_9]|uniref:hypothetical protein n=1 Tax=Raoultella sp. FYR_9 TaxID=3367176 RepID=UPI00370B6A5B
MTDITELAQREKFEAWFEGAEALPWGYLKNRRTSDSAYQDPDITDMWVAWKAAGAELVEALEKAQQRISELESPTFTFEVTAEPFTCPRCGTTTTHPEGWHYCHKREGE